MFFYPKNCQVVLSHKIDINVLIKCISLSYYRVTYCHINAAGYYYMIGWVPGSIFPHFPGAKWTSVLFVHSKNILRNMIIHRYSGKKTLTYWYVQGKGHDWYVSRCLFWNVSQNIGILGTNLLFQRGTWDNNEQRHVVGNNVMPRSLEN